MVNLWSTRKHRYLGALGTLVRNAITQAQLTYNMYDAMTGNYILSIVNGTTAMSLTEDETGEPNWLLRQLKHRKRMACTDTKHVELNTGNPLPNKSIQTRRHHCKLELATRTRQS